MCNCVLNVKFRRPMVISKIQERSKIYSRGATSLR